MIQLVGFFVLMLIAPSVFAKPQLAIEKGSVDLLESDVLSRPFTLLDQLLYSLDKEANEVAKGLRPEKNEFRLSKQSYHSARVEYQKDVSRIGIVFEKTVSAMDEPWRKVCQRYVRRIARELGVAGVGSQQGSPPLDGLARTFFERHLGPTVTRAMSVDSFQPFLDALVVIGQFNVTTADEKTLANLRYCALDIKNDHMTYFEHIY
ncbi:MAG TPA: hypothetical protein VKP13_17570 [Nitrospira sp.]|nr:hypothetical protein [Nitrospira sp.]